MSLNIFYDTGRLAAVPAIPEDALPGGDLIGGVAAIVSAPPRTRRASLARTG